MTLLLLFFLTTLISFLGSVQLGPVNTCVIHTTLASGKKPAAYVALGGIIPELIYSMVAVIVLKLAITYTNWLPVMKVISSIAICGYGLYLVYQAYHLRVDTDLMQVKQTNHPFWLGFTLAILNPMLLPFWLIILTKLEELSLYQASSALDQVAFISGSAAGAFGILWLFILITIRSKVWISQFSFKRINYFFGVVLLLFGVINFLI